MSTIVLFGLPGTGKSYVGKIFKKYFHYYFYDGDEDLTPEMKAAIKTKTVFTDQMRNVYFKILISKIQGLSKKHKKLVVAQTFIKEKYRRQLIKVVPEAKFILIETKKQIREKRLVDRIDYPLDLQYARMMERNFEKPKIDIQIIMNNKDGENIIKEHIQQFVFPVFS
ncbi:MAG: AAA family ATPase [Patescibacteria group bacterium]|jgi:gluconate kinase